MRFFLFFCIIFFSQEITGQEFFRVMFYNVENLYDTIPNPKISDSEFTPHGNLHWNTVRYKKKIQGIAKTISSVGKDCPPALVGLCEVENKNVILDLINNAQLSKHKYKYVITNSKDLRGSNIALLYQRDQFKYISRNTYRPTLPGDLKTRDILHVVGEVVSGDTLDLFLVHFPSRIQGQQKTDKIRLQVANFLRKKIDNIIKIRVNPKIIVMGDFNDYPTNNSLKLGLKTKKIDKSQISFDPTLLYNMFEDKEDDEIKSYKYQGKWGYIDQILTNGCLLDSTSSCYTNIDDGHAYSADFLMDYDPKHGGQKPFRTYSGWTYLGGISDHLPIYIDLNIIE